MPRVGSEDVARVQMPTELLAVQGRTGRAGGFELGQPGGEVSVAENVARPARTFPAGL